MNEAEIVDVILHHYPQIQAVYLFGSYGTEHEKPDSDVDLALLLPHPHNAKQGPLLRSDCWSQLTTITRRPVDLIDLRTADTVFQNEIVRTGRILLVKDENARLEFEMLTLSLYQKLQEERSGIIERILETKRVYNV